jgi:hypothetical protein
MNTQFAWCCLKCRVLGTCGLMGLDPEEPDEWHRLRFHAARLMLLLIYGPW